MGFEPTDTYVSPVFKTGAFSHSATPPLLSVYLFLKNSIYLSYWSRGKCALEWIQCPYAASKLFLLLFLLSILSIYLLCILFHPYKDEEHQELLYFHLFVENSLILLPVFFPPLNQNHLKYERNLLSPYL